MSLLDLLDAADAYHESQTTRALVTAEMWIAYYELDRATGGLMSAGSSGQEDR
jgi:outer membrane protein TolC